MLLTLLSLVCIPLFLLCDQQERHQTYASTGRGRGRGRGRGKGGGVSQKVEQPKAKQYRQDDVYQEYEQVGRGACLESVVLLQSWKAVMRKCRNCLFTSTGPTHFRPKEECVSSMSLRSVGCSLSFYCSRPIHNFANYVQDRQSVPHSHFENAMPSQKSFSQPSEYPPSSIPNDDDEAPSEYADPVRNFLLYAAKFVQIQMWSNAVMWCHVYSFSSSFFFLLLQCLLQTIGAAYWMQRMRTQV